MTISKLRVASPPGAQSARPVDIAASSFPDQPKGRGDGPPCTIANVRHMLDANGVTVRYNIIKKRTEIAIPWLFGTSENADAVSMTHLQSLAGRYSIPTGLLPAMVEAIGDENSYNPAADWILGRKWDGVDRLDAMCATLTPREGYPLDLRDTLMRKWLLSAAAAVLRPAGFRTRGVLTLQGPQGMGKTSWGRSLIDNERLRESLMKVDLHLDPSNKDSQIAAIEHWICEVGELDSSFKRDVARLKGFLTAGSDKVRRPYARVTSDYQRRTVFYATVNASDFLVDETGNSRFWTIPCVAIDWEHDIDVQQMFAQCAVLLEDGAQWWLTADEDALLEEQNSFHRSVSVVRDRLMASVDTEMADRSLCPARTASEVLVEVGIDRPTNAQAKEAAALLREWFGESRRIAGRNTWRVPTRDPDADKDFGKPAVQAKSKFD